MHPLSWDSLSMGHNSGPRGSSPKTGLHSSPSPPGPVSVVLGAKPALRGWTEDGGILGTLAANIVLGTRDSVGRGQRLDSGLGFSH